MKKWIVTLVLLAAAVAGYFWWKAPGREDPIKVLAVETAQRGTVHKVLEQTGIIKAQVGAIVKIGARATGTIEKMLVKVGDRVQKDQLVARIDDRELRALAAEAQAQLESARAEQSRVQRVYPLQIAEAENQLKLSQAQHEYLQQNYSRQAKLAEKNAISRDEIENARQKAEVEARRVKVSQAVLERLRKEFEEELVRFRSAVKKAEAALKALEIRISYTRIHSPITGIVSQVTAQEGETIVAGLQVANLITVVDPTRLEMWIYVDETDIGQVRTGQPVAFRVDAYPDRVFEGAVATIYPEPEIRDNIVYYQALAPITREQAEFLRPEMTTQVQITVEVKENVIRIPNNALKWVDGRQVVFIQEPSGRTREVTPTLGLSGLTHSEVLEGVVEGEQVATQLVLPPRYLKRDGA